MNYRVGIDIGGTFTDCVVIDNHGKIEIFKEPSTPQDPSIGLINSLKKASRFFNEPFSKFLSEIEILVHGTTVCTNAMLQYRGVKTALITTKGFRDSLEMRRAHKEDIWDLSLAHPPMIVPRKDRFGVTERVDYKGEIITPLDEDEVREVARKIKERGIDAVAVCTLFSFINNQNEQRIKEILNEECPEVFVTISSEIMKQVREYERTSTTVVNAYLSPILSKYLKNLRTVLEREGMRKDFLVMQSNGGMMSSDFASTHGVMTLLSGPSAGAVGGKFFSELLEIPNLIVMDMGGTSFDVTLIKEGDFSLTMESDVARYRVCVPAIDIHTIGAGGGSIAHIDEGGLLKVGPISAGAVPGPVCYGLGGERPTTTDANLILGYINPDFFLGGEIKLDLERSKEALQKTIASPLGLSIDEAAFGIHRIVNENMADALRVVSIERGYDPREFVLVAAGGAGPIHASRLAKEVGIPRVIVPRTASVYCALGMLESDLKHDYVRTFWKPLEQVEPKELEQVFSEMEIQGIETLKSEGIKESSIILERYLDMRYIGQHHEVTVRIPQTSLSSGDLNYVVEAFHSAHERLYTYSEPESPVEIINVRLTAIGKIPKTPIAKEEIADYPVEKALKGQREVYFPEFKGRIITNIFDSSKLRPGHSFFGPAIVEAITTTIVVCPNDKAFVDDYGNLIVEVGKNE
ncbi:MAG: hydantoinase/oxoprolinase family protein [Caldiserica bacterium]|jgi:N-methylhydantoinase A|nr:hydantoinase/oxoprolinase family protein [Caldisericota bacterium]